MFGGGAGALKPSLITDECKAASFAKPLLITQLGKVGDL